VKSIISIVFGSKTSEEQLKHWRYWHARQHITKQRIIDIADYKESNMLREIQEFSHNAISFIWDVNTNPENGQHEGAKIFISANCLSTDFSAQKGIKGMALNLQIDSYGESEKGEWDCVHRGTSQIKIFCDKGAERKIRDEERKCRQEALAQNPVLNVSDIKRQEKVTFMTMNEIESVEEPPFYFKPELSSGRALPSHSIDTPPAAKRARLTENASPIPTSLFATSPQPTASITSNGLTPSPPPPKAQVAPVEKPVLLYVREEDEEVFDGVMLSKPTKSALLNSLGEKYGVKVDKVRKFYKRSKKGILVKIDDNIIKHYSHEDTFCIKCTDEADGMIKIVLSEVEN